MITNSINTTAFSLQKNSGFQEWTGAGSYYTINTTDFVLDRPGIGWINNVQIIWAGAQTVSSLSVGNTHFIYIDSSGTIGSTTTRNTALFQNNIVLFEVLVDSDTPTNVIVVKENHSIMTNPETMNSLHDLGAHGYAVLGAQGGTVSLDGTLGVQVDGTTLWHDHDLETTIPDSSGAAVNWNIMHTNGAGKWILLATQNTLPTQYNNAGTPTNLTGNQRSIYDLKVSKDDIESATPKYFAIMDDAVYANLALANTARIAKTYATSTNELTELELIRMGNVVINATAIDSVNVDKETMGGGSITITNSSAASDVSLVTTNFDGWLTAADTTVQAAMETLDDTTFTSDSGTASPASGTLNIVGSGGLSTSATASTVTVDGSGIAGGAWNFISSASASNSTSIDFTSGIDSTYDVYLFTVTAAIPVNDNDELRIRTSTDAGSNFDAGATDYRIATTGTAYMNTDIASGNASGEHANIRAYLHRPSSSSLYSTMTWHSASVGGSLQGLFGNSGSFRVAVEDVDAIRFYFSTGNISSGDFRLYGLSKS